MKSKTTVLLALVMLLSLLLGACGSSGSSSDVETGSAYSRATIEEGKSLYNQTCFACHGPDAKGMANLGKDLTTSEILREHSDEEIVAFVVAGRPAEDPANTTGVAMPPKGGFDFLTNDQILSIVAYARTLQK